MLGYKIREDPTKNERLMKMVESCFGKNFIIHCEKSGLEEEEKKRKDSIFYLHSSKIVNGKHIIIKKTKNC